MKIRQISRLLAGILTFGSLNLNHVRADVVTLNSDQSDYVFSGTNTYYITNSVHVYGTATFEGGAVIKYGQNLYWSQWLSVETPDCRGTATNPVIFTAR